MSYDIYIGEDSGPCPLLERVAQISLPDAPTFPNDEMTGTTNGRHPGYTQWEEFCSAVRLTDLFFGEGGILAKHPGIVPLVPRMLGRVSLAREAWEKAHPGAIPGWGWYMLHSAPTDVRRELDPNLARLLWLEWWMRWALANCKRPAIMNY